MRARRVPIAIALIVAVPIAVLAVRVLASHWISYGDYSAIELRTRAVGTSSTPLLGPFSRYGWSHPGPLLFFALALPYRLLGEHGKALLLGTLVLNTIAAAAALLVCYRRGRVVGLCIGAAIVLLLARALGAGFFVDPWNPYVVVLPTFAVTLLSWDATESGGRLTLPLAIALGSLAVESHVGVALAVAVPILIAVVMLVVERRDRALAETLLISLGVLFLAWLAPLIDEFKGHGGGNLSSLVRFWTTSHARTTGWSEGGRFVSAQLSGWPTWLSGKEMRDPFSGGLFASWHVPYALLLLVAAVIVAVARHDRESTRLCVFAFALIGAGFVSASRIVDVPFTYVVRWLWIVGAITWLAIVWTAVRALLAYKPSARAGAEIVGTAAVAVLALVLTVSALQTHLVDINGDERAMTALAPATRSALRALPQPVAVHPVGGLYADTLASAVATIGIDEGVDARVPSLFESAVGANRTITTGEQGSDVFVAVGDDAQKYLADSRYRLVASYPARAIAPAIYVFVAS
jgi:hypothetical protein